MTYPDSFLSQMQNLLSPEDYGAFLRSLGKPPVRGLRFNKLKLICSQKSNVCSSINPVELLGHEVDFCPIPWCGEGFSFTGDVRPSKWLLYHTGLFYLQEPSAMCPVEVLGAKPGEYVLDLCAAPGGKTVQLAGHMQSRGLLVSNDKSPSRCRGLIKNVELAGITNVVVLSEEPRKLSEHFPEFFDKILVDAPCSGEGMFRKDKLVAAAYFANKPEKNAVLQKELLHFAFKMLKPGGRIVYSTCTFNQTENEEVIADFLERQGEMVLEEIDHEGIGIEMGLALCGSSRDLWKTGRIWPHQAEGEGHFIALLSKKPKQDDKVSKTYVTSSAKLSHENQINANPFKGLCWEIEPVSLEAVSFQEQGSNAPPKEIANFCEQFMVEKTAYCLQGSYVLQGDNLYLQKIGVNLKGLRVARSGFHLGEIKKGRFVPSQALGMAFTGDDFVYKVDLPQDEAMRFLKGESLTSEIKTDILKPWVHVGYKGLPLGFARLVAGRLKNCLPVSWVLR